MKVQQGTKNLPIFLTPRIGGKVVTQTQIKTQYSNHWQNDIDTPMDFWLEYRVQKGTDPPQNIEWNSVESSDSLIVFDSPTGFYDTEVKWSILFYWTVKDANTNLEIERIYTEQPIPLVVENQHNQI